ncbi:hypothetical protein [Nocardia thailandica]
MEQTFFDPTVSPDHLRRFVAQIRRGMPEEVWRILEPWAARPRNWIDPSSAGSLGQGLAPPLEQRWVCEVNAPIPWHEVVESCPTLRLTEGRPTMTDLSGAWSTLVQAGVEPVILVNLGPAADGDHWLVEVSAVLAAGPIPSTAMAVVADQLGGRLHLDVHRPEEWRVWVTHEVGGQ